MTAYTPTAVIVCDGPEDGTRCPRGARDESDRWTAGELREALASMGWEVGVRYYDLPPVDRCPACRNGTP